MKKLLNILFQKWLILPFLAILIFLTTEFAAKNRTWIEINYSQNIYPEIASSISTFSNIFPFSLDDLLYLMLIIVLTILVFLTLIRKYKFLNFIKLILNSSAIIYTLFYVLWGFNYFREDVNNRLNISEQKPDTEVFISVLEKIIDNTNNSVCTFEKENQTDIDSLIENAYKLCAPALKIKFPSGKRKDKKITFSGFFAKAGISGYYGPFFNEVHVNKKVLAVEYPFVLAHEKAHQFGITSEAEANFYAWIICTQSNSKQLRYSANLYLLRYFLYQSFQLKKYPEIIANLDEQVKTDLIRIQENWQKLRNKKIDNVASKVNDAYLKTNKIEKGIEDYKGVVKFVMDFSQDTVFQQTYNLKGI